MSVRLMAEVFARYPRGGSEMLLALALADHAHDDGSSVRPSVRHLAEKTRQSERAVQYQIRNMEAEGWLQLVANAGGGRNNPREYRINPDWVRGANPAPLEKGANHDAKGCKPTHERVQTDARKGATAIAPEPSYNHQEPSEEPLARKRAAIRGSRLPQDWQPDAALADFAAGRGFTGAALAEELDRFRDYWASQPGQRGTKLDWPATFRNWLRNSRGTRYAPTHPADRRPSLVERVAAHAHRIAAAEAISDGHPLAAHDADLRPPLDGTARRIV